MAITSPREKSPSSGYRVVALIRLKQIARELTFPALAPREEQALKREQVAIRATL